jgi:uncharacterized protein YdhG (YjbR/CyaY superfamily)
MRRFEEPLISRWASTKEDSVKKKPGYASIDDYIISCPKDVQRKLTQLRRLIRHVAPNAGERISYQMPAFFLNGVLLWFAAHSNHIGFYPKASAIARFKRELSKYKNAKGSVQFPLDQPLPVELITRMLKFRVQENVRRDKTKTK